EELPQAAVPTASDHVFTAADLQRAAEDLARDLPEAAAGNLEFALEALEAGNLPDDCDRYLDYLLPEKFSLLDYLSAKGLVLFNDWQLIAESAKNLGAVNDEYLAGQIAAKMMTSRQQLRLDLEAVLKKDSHHRMYVSLMTHSMGRLRFGQHLAWDSREPQQFFSQMELLKTELESYAKKGQTVVLQLSSRRQAEEFSRSCHDYDIYLPLVDQKDLREGQAQLTVAGYASGFVLPDSDLVYLTEKELFNHSQRPKKRIKTLENAQRLRSYTELKPGDYVVHVNHGIGRFEGIQTLETDGKKRDYITITYQKGDQLFVPADQLSLVQKYVASEGKQPHINKLGGSEWAKTKKRVAARVEDIADDLIDLYSKREAEKGFAFSPDGPDQAAFEAAFPYEPTADQLRASAEIKADMEKPKPMDRLLV
ncbi:CarD family transcriptional regulator, partial [Lactobacillus nasalidis]